VSDDRPLTRNLRAGGEPPDRAAYEAAGGYRALRRALREHDPDDLIQEVKDARLLGRGGAGFPAGLKWSLTPTGPDAPRPRYLVVNADEMEPGTFKDRALLEGDPHQLVEGIVIAAYALGAERAVVFLRWAYRTAEQRLRRALAEAREAGYVGPDVLGSGFGLDVELHVSAGRYMCGEETALLNALEGRRATPREKPPFPTVSGVWGQPTVVQNVETLCCVPHIVERGAQGFLDLSRCDDGGTKLYGASGPVARPGLWELPLGTSFREILEEHAGGMTGERRLKGFLPGGASTDFLIAEHLDVAADFDAVSEAGSRLGTGTLVVLDDRSCPVRMQLSLQRFFARESCGFCTPCREGLPWVVRLLQVIEDGEGRPEDLDLLSHHVSGLGPGRTFCVLAPGAMAPLGSALKHFREDFERHIEQGGCPYEGTRSGGSQ
jgi:NADH-quinone oxidoreductase subunit F